MLVCPNLRGFCRSAAALLLIASFLPAYAQSPAADAEAKKAEALQLLTDANTLGTLPDKESKLAAIAKIEKAEKLYEELNDQVNVAGTLSLHASLLAALERFDEALALLDRSVAIFRSLNSPESLAIALTVVGSIYYKKKDFTRARDVLLESYGLIEKAPFESADIMILNALANVYIELRDYKNWHDTAWKAFERSKDRGALAAIAALKNLAEGDLRLDLAKSAPGWYEIALSWARREKLKDQEAQILAKLGDVYLYRLDDPDKAKAYLLDALKLIETQNMPGWKADVLNNLGQCAMMKIDFGTALDYYNRALAIADTLPRKGYKANILANIAQIQIGLEDYQRAEANLQAAKTFAHDAGEVLIEASALQGLATIAEKKGDILQAVSLANTALLMIKDNPSARKRALQFAETYAFWTARAGKKDEALVLLARALENARRFEYPFNEASILDMIGLIQYGFGDADKAIEPFGQALAKFRAMGQRSREARTMEHLMYAWDKLGNPPLATFFGKSSVNVYQSFRKTNSSLSAEEQKGFLNNFATGYRKLSEVLIEQGRIAEAEQVLTLLKEQELLEYVRRDDAVAKDLLSTLPVSEDERTSISRYSQIAEQITALGAEFGDLEAERKQFANGEFPKQKRYDELQQQLRDATAAFQKFLESLKLKFGQNDARVAEVDSGLKKTLDRLKAKHTAAVSTIVGEDTLNIIVTTSKTQRAHTVKIKASEINDLVAKFRSALTSPQYDPRPAGQKLYDLIVKPVEGDLAGIKADTILWSLDGSLRYIPPAALWDKKNGYMAERFANVMVNLASRDNLLLPTEKVEQLSVLGVGVSKPSEGFSALTAVPDELDCIVSDKTAGLLSAKPQCSSGVLTGRKLLDDNFTLTNFEGELGRYPIVHIASHFKLTPGDDKNSFLLLGGGDDRKFTVEKLRSEPLTDIDLIVLSACNTATPAGSKTNGIEIEGFGSIAQKEGAKAVMATLWSVADTSTKDFMVEFYRLYGKDGKSKAAAMRKAQLKLMYGKYSADDAQKHRADEFVTATDDSLPKFTPDPNAPFAHPFYWSPFILIGNWR
jgi:CHAT domain-containing protein/Tfp pilus assembly protein PilF